MNLKNLRIRHFNNTKTVAKSAKNDSNALNAIIGFWTSQKKGLNKVVNMATGLFKAMSVRELLISAPVKLALLLVSSISALE